MLRGADIDAMAEQIEHFLTEQKVSRQDTLRLRLTMEELLLRVRDHAGQCNLVLLAIMEHICRLIPLFVFITLLRQIWAGSLVSLLRAWKPLAVQAEKLGLLDRRILEA